MTKRKGKNRRRAAARAKERHLARQESAETTTQATTGGELVVDSDGAGALLEPSRIRSDSRMVARLMSLGVVSEEQAAAVLKKAFVLAAKAETAREYGSAMRVITTAAQVELTATPKRIEHAHAHAHIVRPQPDAGGHRLSAINAKLGIRGVAQ